MQINGISVEWDDRRRFYDFPALFQAAIELRDYQEPAVEALVVSEQGQYQAPTGAGKTVVVLEAIKRVNQPAIIIVERASLAEQWATAVKKNLGIECGYIGEDRFDIQPVTVALRQAIWARMSELLYMPARIRSIQRLFFDLWGALVIDEDHHATSDTLQEIIQRFTARYRWGVSATPRRDEDFWPILVALLGPIVHETTHEDAGEALVTPSVRVLESGFEFDYRPTQIVERIDPKTGEVVISHRTGKPMQDRVQNNYNELLKELGLSFMRNHLISMWAEREANEGHHVLIVSRRKDQLRHLRDLLPPDHHPRGVPTMMLLGGEPGSKKEEIQGDIERYSERGQGTILLSTVAEEGVDIPRLDRLFLVFPFRNTEIVKQPIGRIMRPHPKKTDAVVYDIWDKKIGLLADQYRGRRQQVYNKQGWDVEVISLETSDPGMILSR
jgi:superfamily II DNA or RNA helicase